jgi:hypothetical protein
MRMPPCWGRIVSLAKRALPPSASGRASLLVLGIVVGDRSHLGRLRLWLGLLPSRALRLFGGSFGFRGGSGSRSLFFRLGLLPSRPRWLGDRFRLGWSFSNGRLGFSRSFRFRFRFRFGSAGFRLGSLGLAPAATALRLLLGRGFRLGVGLDRNPRLGG